MAINQLEIAKKIALCGVTNSAKLLLALEGLTDNLNWGTGAGINLVDFDADLAEYGETQHTDGAYLNKLFSKVAVDLEAWLNTQTATVNGHGTKTYMQIVQQCRNT
jgi:hypothetical protein